MLFSEGLVMLGDGISHLMTLSNLFTIAWATLLGIIIGMLPGLTATMGVALLVTLTYNMPGDQAILSLICMYVGAIYGGSRSAILLNIPGTPASAATSLDGHPLAKKGLAGYAMGLATTSSAIGTVVGIFCLALLAPMLSELAFDFGSYEFFWLAAFGVVICGKLTSPTDALKGYISGILGLLVAMIGMESLQAYQRFTFDMPELSGGVGIIPAMVGAFGFAEILTVMRNRKDSQVITSKDRVIPRFIDIWRYRRTIFRSGIIGTLVGIIPGVGEDIGSWASYAAARRASKEKEKFGDGSYEGLTAAETGNSAVIPGAMIPVLTLAIPGSTSAAVLIAAMFIHDIQPGPTLMIQNPSFLYQVIAMLLFTTIAITAYGLSMSKLLIKVLSIPREKLMPIVYILCVVGPFAITQRMFDVYVMIFFGIAGFILRELKFPMAPIVLGIILGTLLDTNLRRGLMLTGGDPAPFFTRPISMVLCAVTFLAILLSIPLFRKMVASLFASIGLYRAPVKTADKPS
ncbi:tripartite tricarboxylate transporter permease [Marinobacterium lutimaris]|uniref:Putative tricarboxylic transport membrane protein n=1 Tax=Marinobacterium lutimaris TaxID=568106 RepID=A0A1H6B3N0_9GAMM|nr:tripartite tricarboxylate transporter permease [Marinobacterium lutimaris]SEG55451.1 putative tricarboxylic transport membrane protein [Marinobacterium lutimaris]